MILHYLIANPDLALILVLAGILLLYAEFNRPGTILFACLGTLLATPGAYALAQHPVDGMAFDQVCTALVLIPISLRLPRQTRFAAAGAFILGCGLSQLIAEKPGIHLTTAIFVSLTFSSVTFWLGRIALQARRNKRLPNPTPHLVAE